MPNWKTAIRQQITGDPWLSQACVHQAVGELKCDLLLFGSDTGKHSRGRWGLLFLNYLNQTINYSRPGKSSFIRSSTTTAGILGGVWRGQITWKTPTNRGNKSLFFSFLFFALFLIIKPTILNYTGVVQAEARLLKEHHRFLLNHRVLLFWCISKDLDIKDVLNF